MVPVKKLNEEVDIPVIGFGTWQLTNQGDNNPLKEALKVGYRHIDTADRYGNHKEVGEALRNSGINREDIFLTTKVWHSRLHHDEVVSDIDRFLEELMTDYLDLVLIHWPNHEVPVVETLKALQECKEAGKIRAIGVSNFTVAHLEEVLASGVEVVNNQVEMHPSLDQRELREYCKEKGISLTAYSPLRSGDMDNPLIKELALKYGKTPAQIIINWIISLDTIVLAQTSNSARMVENISAADFTISPEDLERINNLPDGHRYVDPDFGEFNR